MKAAETQAETAAASASAPWLLLIYTVPAEPSRKRAFIWREVKKAGAIYIRDGVCVLPDVEAALETGHAIAAKVEELGGEATLVEGARLERQREDAIIQASRTARTEEYRQIAQEAEASLEHVRREMAHRDLGFRELEHVERDLAKLRQWAEQVRARDYFGAPGAAEVHKLLQECDEALAGFLDLTFHEGEAGR